MKLSSLLSFYAFSVILLHLGSMPIQWPGVGEGRRILVHPFLCVFRGKGSISPVPPSILFYFSSGDDPCLSLHQWSWIALALGIKYKESWQKEGRDRSFLTLVKPSLRCYEKAGPFLERWLVGTEVGVSSPAGVRLRSPHPWLCGKWILPPPESHAEYYLFKPEVVDMTCEANYPTFSFYPREHWRLGGDASTELGGDSAAQSLMMSLACLIHITSEFLTKDVRSKTTQNNLLSPQISQNVWKQNAF